MVIDNASIDSSAMKKKKSSDLEINDRTSLKIVDEPGGEVTPQFNIKKPVKKNSSEIKEETPQKKNVPQLGMKRKASSFKEKKRTTPVRGQVGKRPSYQSPS